MISAQLLVPMGPVPPHVSDWSLLLDLPWIWVVAFIADIALFATALESTYRYVRYRRSSLFWPLFWGAVSLALLFILLSAKRFGGVVVGPILLGLIVILAALVFLRLTVLAGWQPRSARRPEAEGGERRPRREE